ncbi:MAG TPA: MarR family winged helix-turn-helix transcriptional regulator, partial [Stellaceae bacterium]
NALCERTAMDKVRVSRAVARLLEAGRIEREIDPADRRRAVLALTSAGRAVYAEIVPLALGAEARLLSALTPEERAAFERLLAKLATAADTPFTTA